MNRQTKIYEIITISLKKALALKGIDDIKLSTSTALIGDVAVIDSIDLVTIILDLEETLEDHFGKSVLLVPDGEVLGEDSPFRTIDLLTTHIDQLLNG